ncbi:hypothetical protein DPMN_037479 [Dreissena polymorpha]|uniref:Uncharacterized protein n=1 Tax=Dreissena polymorpha TaxID=45954 RepID=A0A9D4MB33_DREPO|nr:hypothetical protein DPMN_037479 [Dreissena polymorpha]
MSSQRTVQVMLEILVVLLWISCVVTLPVALQKDTLINRLPNLRDRRNTPGMDPSDHGMIVNENVVRLMFPEKQHLLHYLASRSREVKRQRQCYWSVISCF